MNPSKPNWSILIATTGRREERFKKLLKLLLPQTNYKDIEVIAYWNNGELPLANIRQALINSAQGEYISFIDDDDEIPKDYCNTIYPLLDGVDYIGFRLQLYHNGEKMRPTFHSLKYSNWSEDEKGYYRNISHLNPIKRNIVLRIPFVAENQVPEDADWSQRIAPYVKTQHYIKKIMYYYYHNTEDSLWHGEFQNHQDYKRPNIKHPKFSWHHDSRERYYLNPTKDQL